MEQKIADARETAQSASTLDDFDRSTIARVVMYVCAGTILIGFILLLVRAGRALFVQDDDWKSIFADVGDLIKTAVLPIVTLVLGYYFGKSGKG